MAVSDPGGILASPLTIIERDDETQAIDAILRIVDQQQAGVIIVGLPLSMAGGITGQTEKVKNFSKELGSLTDVPIKYRDERLTTVSAGRLMRAARSKRTKNKVRDDAAAAALILQGYLDEIPER